MVLFRKGDKVKFARNGMKLNGVVEEVEGYRLKISFSSPGIFCYRHMADVELVESKSKFIEDYSIFLNIYSNFHDETMHSKDVEDLFASLENMFTYIPKKVHKEVWEKWATVSKVPGNAISFLILQR